jgi:hypothetical protein
MSAVITGLVNLLATFVSVFTVDRVGRRALLLEGGLQMLVSMVALLRLRRPARCHDPLCRAVLAGDQGGAHRVHGRRLGEALVLEALRPLR